MTMPDGTTIGDFLLECANSDNAPEDLIILHSENMDGADIATLFEVIAHYNGYDSIHNFLTFGKTLAREIIDATQSNPNKSWDAIWKIAILQEVLEGQEEVETDEYPEPLEGAEWD